MPVIADDTELFERRTEPVFRAQIAERYDGLATGLAYRFRGRGQDTEDLNQVARVGLMHAINRFEPERGFAFSTFATRTIVGELKRHLRDKAWAVRVPRSLQERSLEVGRAVQDLTHKYARSPTLKEIAAAIDASVEEVIEALEAGHAYAAASVDTPTSDEHDLTLADTLGDSDPLFANSADRVAIAELVKELPDRQRVILYERFYEGRTQSEIAETLGISQMHVSRLLRSALTTLRQGLAEE